MNGHNQMLGAGGAVTMISSPYKNDEPFSFRMDHERDGFEPARTQIDSRIPPSIRLRSILSIGIASCASFLFFSLVLPLAQKVAEDRIFPEPSSSSAFLNSALEVVSNPWTAWLSGLSLGMMFTLLAARMAIRLDRIPGTRRNQAVRWHGELESHYPGMSICPVPRIRDMNWEVLNAGGPWADAIQSMLVELSELTSSGIPRSIAFTSSQPAEGKTNICFAVANALASNRRRVVIVDADMRFPCIHRHMGVRNDVGLSNYLSGPVDVSGILRAGINPYLHCITAGPRPKNPSSLLSEPAWVSLIEALKEDFAHVIVDCPPVMHLADAPLIARECEATIFVAAAEYTRLKTIDGALKRLRSARVGMIVLNKVRLSLIEFGESGYGYGEVGISDP